METWIAAKKREIARVDLLAVRSERWELRRHEVAVEVGRHDCDRSLPSGELAVNELAGAQLMQLRVRRVCPAKLLSCEKALSSDLDASDPVSLRWIDSDLHDVERYDLP
jgi:hypothetical protein